MSRRTNPGRVPVPLDSLVFGYGPTAPLLAGAAGVWGLKPPASVVVAELDVIWGAMILVFLAGVRRGYGFGVSEASTPREICAMLTYFVIGGVGLILLLIAETGAALLLLTLGFALAAVLDRRAAFSGDAPAHFARLRGPQMSIAAAALALAAAPALAGPALG